MIERIGVIYQDRNSLGFLRGLRDRLKCKATLIPGPTAIGKPRNLTRTQATLAWRFFQRKNVDLIVRFTDADRARWQQVRQAEKLVFPDQAKSLVICGVAVDNPEDWLCLDVHHLAQTLGLSPEELRDPAHRSDRVKSALARLQRDRRQGNLVEEIVRELPPKVFHRWLQRDDSLREFYSDCRHAATAEVCETPNELDAPL